MAYLIGTDEAGYGPNLGPLVISASVWEVPDGVASGDLYERLDSVVAPAGERAERQGKRIAIADSKILYQSGKGLRLLERGLWAAWCLLGHRPATCADVWRLLAGHSLDDDSNACNAARARREALCHGFDSRSVPLDADLAELEESLPLLLAEFGKAGVRLVALRSRVVFSEEFNLSVKQCGSKGQALSRWTLALIAEALDHVDDKPISILCDKHGGRDYYLPFLVECFPETFVEIREEGPRRSVYRFGPEERRVEICFQAKAESHLPTALASMASKYLRELAMHALNAFWLGHVSDLRPTAGYPNDAWRFKNEIEAARRKLKIKNRQLWRVK